MRHIYRQKKSGRYYVRVQFPKAFKRTHPHLVPKSAEIRLSLYSTNHAHAVELAKASWLAAREVIRSPHLTALGIKTFTDLKNHIRASVATHLPQQYTSLIELTGSADTQSLQAAIKLLIAYNTDFYILPPKMGGIIHKYKQPSPRYSKGSYEAISTVTGQTFPPMRITKGCINDVINNNRETLQPDWLYYEAQGEKFCLKTEEAFTINISQLFVPTDLPANVITSIRRFSEIRLAPSTPSDEHRKSSLLSEEIQNYIKFKKTTWTPKTQGECETQLRIFNEMLTDKNLLQLTSKDYDFYIQNIPRWPANSSKNKLYKGKTAREIAMMPDPEKAIGPDRIESYHRTITGFIRWAADRDENKGMNTSILRMKPQTNQVKGDGYVAFPPEHLSKIFESDLAISFLVQAKHPYQQWIPALGLFLGSRLDELCSLQTNQIGTENGIHYIEIQKGKTENAARKVPIHPVLEQLGFLHFVDHKKSLGEKRLFPECKFVKKHGYKKAASRWFGEFLDHLGITDKKYVFHSFRHNVSNVLNEVDTLKSWRISRYLGHAIPPGASESERSYFKQRKLEHLLPVAEALKYPIDWTLYEPLCRKTYTK